MLLTYILGRMNKITKEALPKDTDTNKEKAKQKKLKKNK